MTDNAGTAAIPRVLAPKWILVVNSGSLCGEAEFEACQVAGPPPV